MKIIHFAINDPAGAAIAFVKATNTYTPHRARLVTWEIRYNFMYEKDLHLPWMRNGELEALYTEMDQADIFHFHMLVDENQEVGRYRIADFMRGKKVLHHHHGHPGFRSAPQKYREKYRRLRRKALVSTPDLLRLMPEATWQPNLVPLGDPLYMPELAPENGCVIIGQAPTRRDLKNTQDLLNVVADIRGRGCGSGIKAEIIENTNHKVCLQRKRRCHIIFDHMQGYYGVTSLESLSQGKPVIAGLDEWNVAWIKRFTGSDTIPWLIARDVNDLEIVLRKAIKDQEYRLDMGQKSRHFMESNWHEPGIIQTMLDVYHSA